MKCPNDGAVLVMSDKNGIEIDYCPDCRGVWLDRGELDKIIERNQSGGRTSYAEPSREERHYPKEHDQYHHKKKRESFLGDLFDF